MVSKHDTSFVNEPQSQHTGGRTEEIINKPLSLNRHLKILGDK